MKKSSYPVTQAGRTGVRAKAALIVRKIREMNYSARNYTEALSLYFAYKAELPSSELSNPDISGIHHAIVPVLSEIGEHIDINGPAIMSEISSIYRERYNLVFNPAAAIIRRVDPKPIDDRTATLVASLLKLDD